MRFIIYIGFSFIFLLISCSGNKTSEDKLNNNDKSILEDTTENTIDSVVIIEKPVVELSDLEKIFIDAGLVDIRSLDSAFIIDLKYATTDNFLGINMYGDINRAYLQKDVAEKLVDALNILRDSLPGYTFIVFDAARPKSIQQLMWDSIDVPPSQRPKYLSKPKYGSIHNFGAAVDLNIVDDEGNILDMGTPFDSFEKLAYPVLEEKNLKAGLLSQEQYNNRKLLRGIMEKADFFGIQTEWWHFNSCRRKVARKKYALIEKHYLEPEIEEVLIAEKTSDESIDEAVNVYYSIQVKISYKKLALDAALFKGLDVEMYEHKGIYKYVTGKYKSLGQAHQNIDDIRSKYFSDAFVVAFNGSERISVKDAEELLN